MAGSGKRQSERNQSGKSGGAARGKGENSRTGGAASPREPKPKRGSAEAKDTPQAGGKAGGGVQPRARARRPGSPSGRSNDSGRGRAPSENADPTIAEERGDGGELSEDAEDAPAELDGGSGSAFSLVDRVKLMFLQAPATDEDATGKDRPPARTREAPAEEYLPDGTRVPRWGLGDVLIGFLAGFFLPPLVTVLAAVGLGYVLTAHSGDLGGTGAAVGEAAGHVAIGQPPEVVRSLEYAPMLLWWGLPQLMLWVALVGVPFWATWRKGNGPVRDLGLRVSLPDVPIGLAVGVACQLLLIPIYAIVDIFTDEDVTAVARQVTDLATDPLSALLVFATVGIGAPIAEEIFYRGLTLRAAERRFGRGWALAGTSAFFAIMHGHLIVLPGLVLFAVALGVMTQRTGRLGPAIFAHMGFNLVTATLLVYRLDLPFT